MRVAPMRSTLATLSILSVFHAACAAKSGEQASSRARPCTNYVLFIDNNTDSNFRIYRGTTVVAEVNPRSTRKIAIQALEEVRYGAALVRPEAAIDPATNPRPNAFVIRPGDPDRSGSIGEGVNSHLTCQE